MKAVSRQTGLWYAVKVIHTTKLFNSHATNNGNRRRGDSGRTKMTQFQREIEIMEKLTHPNICQLKEVFVEDASISMVFSNCWYIRGIDRLGPP
jgi:ser/thr/tyr protein kinase RAD53